MTGERAFGVALSIIPGRQPQPPAMHDPQSLSKKLYAVRFAIKCRRNRRAKVVVELDLHDRALAKLSKQEIDLSDALHHYDPQQLAQVDESTRGWGQR